MVMHLNFYTCLFNFCILFPITETLLLKYFWIYFLPGYVSVKTTAWAGDTVIAKMAKLVEDSHGRKSRTQKFIDNCAKYYIPGKCQVNTPIFSF